MVYKDSRGRSSSYSAAESEECDSEDVVTAHVADSYKKSSGWQDTCSERRMEVWRDEHCSIHMMGAFLTSALPNTISRKI